MLNHRAFLRAKIGKQFLALLLIFAAFLIYQTITPSYGQISSAAQASQANISSNSLAPDGACCGNLVYHGGPVMHNPTNYVIFWLPPGYHYDNSTIDPNATSPSDNGYESLINYFFSKVGNTSYYNLLNQYPDKSGPPGNMSSLGGFVFDTSPYTQFTGNNGSAAKPLNNTDITMEVAKQITSHSPYWRPSANSEYWVFTGYKVVTCFSAGAACIHVDTCAYHWNFTMSGVPVIYTNMPDVSSVRACTTLAAGAGNGPNRDPFADSEINVMSHELFESVTNPIANSTMPFGTGWYYKNNTGEIGDECNFFYGRPPALEPDGSDVWLNGLTFLVQFEWSNANGGCTLDRAGPPQNVTLDLRPSTGSRSLNTTNYAKVLFQEAGSPLKSGSPVVSYNYNGTKVTLWVDKNSPTLIFPVIYPNTEAWCLAATETSGSLMCPTVTVNSGTTGGYFLYYYFDLLPQNVSLKIVGGGSPKLPNFYYFTAPATPRAFNHVPYTDTVLNFTAQIIWAQRNTTASAPSPGTLQGSNSVQRWIANPYGGNVTSKNSLPNPIVYYHQYYLNFSVAPPSAGTVNRTNGWFNAGSKIGISATAKSRYVFLTWTTTNNSITFSNLDESPTSATISGWGNITANFGPTTVTPEFPMGTITMLAFSFGALIVFAIMSSRSSKKYPT